MPLVCVLAGALVAAPAAAARTFEVSKLGDHQPRRLHALRLHPA